MTTYISSDSTRILVKCASLGNVQNKATICFFCHTVRYTGNVMILYFNAVADTDTSLSLTYPLNIQNILSRNLWKGSATAFVFVGDSQNFSNSTDMTESRLKLTICTVWLFHWVLKVTIIHNVYSVSITSTCNNIPGIFKGMYYSRKYLEVNFTNMIMLLIHGDTS